MSKGKIIYLQDYKDKIEEMLKAKAISLEEIEEKEINTSNMLKALAKQEPNHAFVITWNKDGSIVYSSSTRDIPVISMRLHQFIHKLYNGDFSDD